MHACTYATYPTYVHYRLSPETLLNLSTSSSILHLGLLPIHSGL